MHKNYRGRSLKLIGFLKGGERTPKFPTNPLKKEINKENFYPGLEGIKMPPNPTRKPFLGNGNKKGKGFLPQVFQGKLEIKLKKR